MQLGKMLFSSMFLIVSFIYFYWGTNIFKINKKEKLNRAFWGICIAMTIWSFSFAMSNFAFELESALIWRRISAIGWTSVYSLMLHFSILLSQKTLNIKESKLLYLIYIPTFINMYVFSFSNKLANFQYNMTKIDYGWTNISYGNGFDYYFRFYYLTYMAASIFIIWRWQKKLEDKKIAKKAKNISFFLVLSVILGTITDIVMTALLKKPIPQLGPVLILLPAGAMYHTVKYFDLFQARIFNRKEIILTKEEEKKILNNISLGFYIAGILTFFSEYLPKLGELNAFKVAFVKAIIISSIGIIIKLSQKIKKENKKRIITTIILTLSIPISLSLFIKDANVTVWAFTMILIISSTIFSDNFLIFSITGVSVMIQLLTWIFTPQTIVIIDQYDFILRVAMLLVAFFIALSINKMYLSKIKDNKNQIRFQKIISDILFDFLDINKKNFNCRVNKLLEKIGVFFGVDRTYLFTINHSNETMTYSYEWCNEGIKAEVGTIDEIPLEVFPWWIKELEINKMVYIEDVDQMPEEANKEQAQLYRQEVKSLISIPVIINDRLEAFIGIDSVLEKKTWEKENIDMLNIMANILSSGIMQIEADKEIETMAYYDNLTGLPNRFLFEDRINSAISLADRNNKLVSLMLIDLDDFKLVNDTMGHTAGDMLLKEIGKRLSRRIRRIDTVSRFGGDEFLLLFSNIEKHEGISRITENIMNAFLRPFIINEQEFFVTASAGISTFPIDGRSSDTLIKNADIAMYEAKDKGKNQYSLCTDYMKDKAEKNAKLSNDLYRALERNQLEVYYQPQLSLEDRKIIGLEALMRWSHPEHGLISPGVFIPLAEKNGLINSIGKWVLKRACIQIKKWQDMGFVDLKIAVNLSGAQVMNESIVKEVEKALKESKLDAKYLELEITENIAIKETDLVVNVLNKLKNLGVSIAIDDFGTEYSSLNRLKNLPIDKIKIDMAFIQGIEKNKKDQAITTIIINLAKSLEMNVLAEGVETDQQVEFLNQRMCNYVQGYYYYKPMPAEEVETILKELKGNL